MSIQEKLNSLRPYVIGIRYINDMPVVDAKLKDNWSLLKNDKIKKIQDDNDPTHLIFVPAEEEGLEIDDVLGYVEQVINYNRENERKHELLQQKVQELKEVFRANSFEDLQNLKFVVKEEEYKSDDLLGADNLVDLSLAEGEEKEETTTNEAKEEPKKEEEEKKTSPSQNGKKKNSNKKKKEKKEHTTNKVPNQKVELPTEEEIPLNSNGDEECTCDNSKGEYCDKCREKAEL